MTPLPRRKRASMSKSCKRDCDNVFSFLFLSFLFSFFFFFFCLLITFLIVIRYSLCFCYSMCARVFVFARLLSSFAWERDISVNPQETKGGILCTFVFCFFGRFSFVLPVVHFFFFLSLLVRQDIRMHAHIHIHTLPPTAVAMGRRSPIHKVNRSLRPKLAMKFNLIINNINK